MAKNQQQIDNDKEAKRLIRLAYRTGGTVSFSMRYMIELGVSVKVIKSVLRPSL